MADISSLGAMAGLIQSLPEIMFWMQIAVYVFLVLFFGSIAVKGYRGYLRGPLRFLLRVGSGIACLLAGIGLSSMLPGISDNVMLRVLQIDMIIGGVLSSLVLLACFYIITFRFPRTLVIKKRIEKLQRRLEKTRDRAPSRMKADPLIMVGAVIMVVFLAFSLANFSGFPNMTEDLFSQMGITPEEFSRMGSLLGGQGGTEGGGLEAILPEGVVIEGGKPLAEQSQACVSAMVALAMMKSQLEDPEFLMSHEYLDQGMKSLIESGSGKDVVQMFMFVDEGRNIIMAITGDMFTCVATPQEFCTCLGSGA